MQWIKDSLANRPVAKRAPSGKPKWPKARIFVVGRILRAGPSVIANRKQIEAAMIERRIVMNIANKTVLITGASRGIGQALVDEALRRGAKSVYAGTRSGALQNSDRRVTPLTLDVTDLAQIQRGVDEVGTLDVLINNAGIAIYDDLNNLDVIEQHLAVNFLGMLKMTRAFLPLLRRSKGAIVNNLSLAALAPLPVIPGYSISKAAASNMTQSLRALLAGQGVTVHAVFLGPIDTDMNRGFDIPKASTESAARGIFDGLEKGDEDIFPDPSSQLIAEGWRTGAAKALERQFAAFVPQSAANAAQMNRVQISAATGQAPLSYGSDANSLDERISNEKGSDDYGNCGSIVLAHSERAKQTDRPRDK
jgi:NAD(P)-dependent dehydrogenase (short-subunit alcohol dehydrogenase family)